MNVKKLVALSVHAALLFFACGDVEAVGSMDLNAITARIEELTPFDKDLPENELRLADERREIDTEISKLREILSSTSDTSKDIALVNRAKSSATSLIDQILAANCNSPQQGPFIYGRKLLSQYSSISSVIFRNDWEGEITNPFEENIFTIRETDKLSAPEQCRSWQSLITKENKIKFLEYFDNVKEKLEEQAKANDSFKTKAEDLLKLIEKRKEIITKKLGTVSGKNTLFRNLWLVISIIGGLSLGAILIVRLFNDQIQIEWVASGQVIQFVTVMILLSVILALGLTEILKENTLGTLLGGIAGYVLAQGVGRAAAREVTRGRDALNRSSRPNASSSDQQTQSSKQNTNIQEPE